MPDGDEHRRCTNCGKSVEDHPYEYWLFHTCRSCAAERAPKRWSDIGTARKFRYFPRWHMTEHPALPDHVRQRYATHP